MTGFEIAAFIGSNRSRSAVIPTKVGIQFFEFQSFPINCLSIECLDSRLRGNDGILGFCNLGQLSVIVLTQRHHFNLLHRPAQKTLADGSEFQRNITDIKTIVGIIVVGIE